MIFLPVRQIGTKTANSLTSIISLLISRTDRKRIRLRISGTMNKYDLSTIRRRLSSIIKIRQQLSDLDRSENDKIIQEIKKETGVRIPDSDENLLLMNWDEVLSLGRLKPYISFGSHTLTHPDLTKISETEMEKEIALSKKELERILNKKIFHLAYPYGYYNEAAINASRKAGYSLAVTTEYGYNEPSSDPLRLKRIAVDNKGMAFFMLSLFFDIHKYNQKIMLLIRKVS